MTATIEFSAQFGGRDAAAAALPHFRILKSIAHNYSIEKFPFQSLAFILRVDGEITEYNLSGPGNIDSNATEYLSIDLGISSEDYRDCSNNLVDSIADALTSSVNFLRKSTDSRLDGVDYDDLETILNQLSDSYRKKMGD